MELSIETARSASLGTIVQVIIARFPRCPCRACWAASARRLRGARPWRWTRTASRRPSGLPPPRRAGEAQPTRTSRIKPAVNCALPIRTQRPSGYSLKAGLSRSARGSTRSARISPQALNLKNGGQTQRREERKGKYLETILTGLGIFIFALKLVL